MPSYEEFAQEIGRMPNFKRSSLNNPNESNNSNVCDTRGSNRESSRRQTNPQPNVSSPRSCPQSPSRQQGNFQIYEDSYRPSRQTNLRARYIDPGYSDSNLVTPVKVPECPNRSKSPGFAQQFHDSASFLQACSRGGRGTSELPAESYNESGRALNLSNLGGCRARSLNPADFGGGIQQGPGETYQTSGRALNLSDFGGDTARDVQVPTNFHNKSAPERRSVGVSTQRSQPASETYTISGRPCSLGESDRRTPAIRIQSEPFNDSGRPLNMADFGTGRTPRLQDSCNASNQSGGQYLQVPREQKGYPSTGGDLSRTLQVPCERIGQSTAGSTAQTSISQCATPSNVCTQQGSVFFQNQPQSTLMHSNVCPSAKQQGDCPLPSSRGQVPCPQQQQCPVCPVCPGAQVGPNPNNQDKQQCPDLSQEQLLQFLQNGDPNQLNSGPNAPRTPLFNNLVKDKYYPGAIEDAVNGKIDFNRIAFDATFDCNNIPTEIEPDDVPMSLLEAFDLRIQHERDLLEIFKGRKESCLKEQKTELEAKHKPGYVEPEEHPDQTKFWIHRDELKLACTIDIDLSSNIRDQPETGLTEAIACLLKAEKMNDFDQYVHLAEEAIRSASPENYEKSQCSFQLAMHKDEVKTHKTYKPIEVISYIGTTKPFE